MCGITKATGRLKCKGKRMVYGAGAGVRDKLNDSMYVCDITYIQKARAFEISADWYQNM